RAVNLPLVPTRGSSDLVRQHQKLSVLVNNAGITRDNLAMRMKDSEWLEVIETNLTAVFRLSRLVIRPMMKQRYGRIISITSVVGDRKSTRLNSSHVNIS